MKQKDRLKNVGFKANLRRLTGILSELDLVGFNIVETFLAVDIFIRKQSWCAVPVLREKISETNYCIYNTAILFRLPTLLTC